MNQSAPLDANPLELIACHECDTLHRIPALAPGRSAHCSCCGALLVHNPKGGLERPIALNIAALILLVVGINLFADWLREELNPKIQRKA